jgi:hypothetical protein
MTAKIFLNVHQTTATKSFEASQLSLAIRPAFFRAWRACAETRLFYAYKVLGHHSNAIVPLLDTREYSTRMSLPTERLVLGGVRVASKVTILGTAQQCRNTKLRISRYFA